MLDRSGVRVIGQISLLAHQVDEVGQAAVIGGQVARRGIGGHLLAPRGLRLKLVGVGRSAAEFFGAGSGRSGHDDPGIVVRLDEVQVAPISICICAPASECVGGRSPSPLVRCT
jgi:hypothetical protein